MTVQAVRQWPVAARAAWATRPWVRDAAVAGAYLVGALWVTVRLWTRPDAMVEWWTDNALFEWHLAHAAHALTHLENPFYSTSLNAPDGANIMANTSALGLGIPLAPVTLLFGAHATFVLCLILSFAGTATGWYLLLSRTLGRSRPAALVGGLVCGFAPGLVSQAQGHLHMAAQFLVPPIVWAVLRLDQGSLWRRGLVLGLLVSWQALVGEELLLLTALGLAVFVVALVCVSPAARERSRRFAAGLGIAAGVAVVLLAYPLWFQFLGPGHYQSLPFDPARFPLDVRSYLAYSRYSLAGQGDQPPTSLAPNMTEENSFFGTALVALCVVIVVWLWRQAMVKALAITMAFFALLSLGSQLTVSGHATGVPGPYRLLHALPLLDHIVPARFALVLIPPVAVLVAVLVDHLRDVAPAPALRRVLVGMVAATLLPAAPLPLPTHPAPVPAFIASGEWRTYVPEGRTVVPVPPTGFTSYVGMLWSARTDLAFAIPGGVFIGPAGPDDTTGAWSASPERPTATLLNRVSRGEGVTLTEADRRNAIADLRHWRAALIVLGEAENQDALRQTIEALVGPGRYVAGAWIWDVRDMVDAGSLPTEVILAP